MSFRRLVAAGALALLPLAGLFGVSQAGATPSRIPNVAVATTGTDSPTCGFFFKPCATITFALGRVTFGGKIHVAPGTYAEQLVISAPVSIVGSGAATVLDPTSLPTSDTDTDTTTPQLAIVDVTPGTGGVGLSNLTINGAGASPSFTGCGADFVGVYFHSASGWISNVNVENIELPPSLFGCQDGQGIYVASETGAHAHVTMNNVDVSAYDKNGITCDDEGTWCSITGSTVTGIGPTPLIAQNGIQIYAASARLCDNTISANSYTDPNYDPSTETGYTEAIGILVINAGQLSISGNTSKANDVNAYLLEDAQPGSPDVPPPAPTPGTWSVVGNNFSGAVNNSDVPTGAGIGDGLDIDSTTAPVLVDHNTANDNPEFGFGIIGASGAKLTNDTANNSGVGFGIVGPGSAGNLPTDNVLAFDTALNSDVDGFVSYPSPTSGMVFFNDTSLGSGNTDVVDLSTGTGTVGTANSWIGTVCKTSTPTGICGSHHLPPRPPHCPWGPHACDHGIASKGFDHSPIHD